MDRGSSKLHRCILLLRNIFIASLAYASVVEVLHIYQTGSIYPFSKAPPKVLDLDAKEAGSLSGGVNWRLRPETLVKDINDAYLGERPHVDTFANYTHIIEACRGSETKLERMRYVYDCLAYLSQKQDDYYFMPDSPPSKGHTSIDAVKKPSKTDLGECPGPVQLFHTYWTGPSTWRVEIFVKSYLYTQNLPCSRLYIWLDSDNYPKAVENMMNDPGFVRFLPLVERGDIELKAWHFPSRIPLPKQSVEEDPLLARYIAKLSDDSKSAKGEVPIADGVVRMQDGSYALALTEREMTFLPVAVSDAVRFVVLHLYGGVYMDMDVLMLRDFRPLLLPADHNFAERWAVHSHPGDYNTAVMSLAPNTSLSTYLVRGGVRMGMNFHPRIIGRMAWKDGRVGEFAMFETGLFDPIWGEFNWGREGRCTIPCFKDYGVAFKGTRTAIKDEWQSYDDEQLPLKELSASEELKVRTHISDGDIGKRDSIQSAQIPQNSNFSQEFNDEEPEPEVEPEKMAETFTMPEKGSDGTYGGRQYNIAEDKYPPNNRTLQNFFNGAYSYHIHNQWLKHPQPNSWFDVMQKAEDGFLSGKRLNPYGERWEGPEIAPFDRWPEFD